MNKQELINKAVEDLKGATPENDHLFVTLYDDYVTMPMGYVPTIKHTYVCSKAEFERRAKELGWINGCKWGVEYPTNGKKPDLGGDVEIKGFFNGVWGRCQKISSLDWDFNNNNCIPMDKFIITDDRYKPIHHTPETGKMVNSWFEHGELPPVGTECEVFDGAEWYKTKIIGMDDDYCVYVCRSRDEIPYQGNSSADYFRPIKSEREKFIIEMHGHNIGGYIVTKEAAADLYDAGCRFTE